MIKRSIRRTKTPAVVQPPRHNQTLDPISRLENERRRLYTACLGQICNLPDQDLLPDYLRAEIEAHSRKQTSETDLMVLTDCSVGELKQLLTLLLEPPHLRQVHLGRVIHSFLGAFRIQQADQDMAPVGEKDLEMNHRIYRRLQAYVRKHLSVFLPPATGATTDVPLEQLQEDLRDLHKTEDLFLPLFSSDIPAETIKTFLATHSFQMPTGDYNIRWAVQKFARQHQFDLIRAVLEKTPTVSDWASELPPHYYQKFPPSLWKLQTWPEFSEVLERSLQYSMDISEFLRFYFSKQRLRIIPDEKESRRPAPKRNPIKIPKIRNPAEEIFMARYRPDIPNLVSVLLQPVECPRIYLGKAFSDYFFPTDRFFHDLVVYPHEQIRGVLHIHKDDQEQEDGSRVRVFHLMTDGRILPQSLDDYRKGVRYIEDSRRPDRQTAQEFLLKCQLAYLSRGDLDFVRNKIRCDISIFLNLLYTDKMQTDKIASQIERAVFVESIHLDDYLSRIFVFIVQLHPRYELCASFPEIQERWDLFFYRLDVVMPELGVWFPRLHVFDDRQQEEFRSWLGLNESNYKSEMVLTLMKTNYDFLRVKMPLKSVSSRVPDVCLLATTDMKLSTMVYYDNGQWLELARIGQAITDKEEIVGIDDRFIRMIDRHFQKDRITKGLSAVLIDTGYEVFDQTEDRMIPKNDFSLPITPLSEETDGNLPNFRFNALAYLNRL